MADTGDKVIRVYSDFRGIDLRGEECALNRSPDAINVWRDYRELSGIKTRPALKRWLKRDKAITGISANNKSLFFINDGYIYECAIQENGTAGAESQKKTVDLGDKAFFFDFNGKIYAVGKSNFVDAETGIDVTAFVPTTSIGSLPDGTGRQTYQDVNMLTPYRINTFKGDDGVGMPILFLDTEKIDDETPEVKINGKDAIEYFRDEEGIETTIQFNRETGAVAFENVTALPAPEDKGKDNISVKFKKTVQDYPGEDKNMQKILGCTMAQEFDNRIFFSGNPQYPNLVFHSSLNDVGYFSDLDVYEDGTDDGHICAMASGNNALWVFRDTDKGNGVYYHTAAFDNTYGKVYPSAHSSVSVGCVGGAVNFLDDILFFSRNGMDSISQNVTAEQFATHKSSLVDRLMLQNAEYENMVFAEWEGYLLVFIGHEVYLADSRAVLANEGHYEYEWYRWELFEKGSDSVTCATVYDGNIYIGTQKGYIFTLDKEATNGDEYYNAKGDYAPIASYWTTPRDKFASSNKQKTTNKKGCIIEALGDFNVSSKVDGDDTFDAGDTYTDVKDHVVTKIKRKKFKDIQLKFSSNTKFTLESATLEAFVGSFIKR